MNKATACAVGWSGTVVFSPGNISRTLFPVHQSYSCPIIDTTCPWHFSMKPRRLDTYV